MPSLTLFYNGSVFQSTPSGSHFHSALLCDGESGSILSVGSEEEVRSFAASRPSGSLEEVDLQGRLVLPAFIDAHVHISLQGDALDKVDLEGSTSVEEIQSRIRDEIQRRGLEGQEDAKILVKRWTMEMMAGRAVKREDLDACSEGGEVAVFVEARDLHSSWLSSKALQALGVTASTPDPAGGKIHREPDGQTPSGQLEESAHFSFVWGGVPKLYTRDERKQTLLRGMESWLQEGVCSVVDMAMEADTLQLLKEIYDERKRSNGVGSLPLRVACHWLVQPKATTEEDFAQVHKAKRLQEELSDAGYHPWLFISGIKLITDGVIDACTASLHEPYHDGSSADPIWPLEKLQLVITEADRLGLQCAVHAIGDKAVDTALDAIEYATKQNGAEEVKKRRHRIEHLELTRADSVPRLAALGVVASVQAVHADPGVQDNWRAMLANDHRCSRSYAYGDFLSQGVKLALGTDAPTAGNSSLHNLYVAVTRTSPHPRHAHLPPTTPQWAIPMIEALQAATKGAAWASKMEDRVGELKEGMQMDAVVLSCDITASSTTEDASAILKAKVDETWLAGRRSYTL